MEIKRHFINAKEQKVGEIAHEGAETIALVIHGAAFVFFQVVFRVVHSDVVAVVAFGRLAEKRPDYPRQIVVENIIFPFEPFSMAGAMKHQTKWAFVNKVVGELVGHCQNGENPSVHK